MEINHNTNNGVQVIIGENSLANPSFLVQFLTQLQSLELKQVLNEATRIKLNAETMPIGTAYRFFVNTSDSIILEAEDGFIIVGKAPDLILTGKGEYIYIYRASATEYFVSSSCCELLLVGSSTISGGADGAGLLFIPNPAFAIVTYNPETRTIGIRSTDANLYLTANIANDWGDFNSTGVYLNETNGILGNPINWTIASAFNPNTTQNRIILRIKDTRSPATYAHRISIDPFTYSQNFVSLLYQNDLSYFTDKLIQSFDIHPTDFNNTTASNVNLIYASKYPQNEIMPLTRVFILNALEVKCTLQQNANIPFVDSAIGFLRITPTTDNLDYLAIHLNNVLNQSPFIVPDNQLYEISFYYRVNKPASFKVLNINQGSKPVSPNYNGLYSLSSDQTNKWYKAKFIVEMELSGALFKPTAKIQLTNHNVNDPIYYDFAHFQIQHLASACEPLEEFEDLFVPKILKWTADDIHQAELVVNWTAATKTLFVRYNGDTIAHPDIKLIFSAEGIGLLENRTISQLTPQTLIDNVVYPNVGVYNGRVSLYPNDLPANSRILLQTASFPVNADYSETVKLHP